MKKDSSQKIYDIIIIGAGSGGLNIAAFANRIGLSTLLIDRSDKNIGGDCLNFGCVPSKALIHIARAVHTGRNLEKFRLKTTGTVDMSAVMTYVKSRQDIIRKHENADWFRKSGISVVLGEAKFIGPNKIVVGDTAYESKRIVLATGSRPRSLSLSGIEHTQIFNNENIFDIDFLPKNLVIIGGGPIGIEIGQAFQHLGSQVTILEQGEKFLPKEDKDITDILYKQLVSEGMNVLFHAQAKNIRENGELVVEVDGQEQLLPTDALFVGIGRQLNIEGLDLDKANIELEESGQKLKVDQYLRTTNKNIVVCGDVAGQYQFTHAAELHAGVIIRNWFSPFKKKLINDNLSWVTYTDPEIATFGISVEELKKRGVSYETIMESFSHDDRAITDDYRDNLLKIHISKKGKILGGTMIAPHAGELIQELIFAQTHNMSLSDIFTKIYPYPTATRINKRIAQNYQGRKLNQRSKKLLRMLFQIFG
ncbi:mercuric reductase [Candidatus Roizmanbacteria bacterium CG22_combo_CG10-13_8_21_14_all_38_20]|uniref:Mercuric reductase n=1 Tax=Candidatus Roizmanbacteria bacterium CG22_combo_CG10-13_8_21_14_all_38_20 TaxID=1974862 RepID=A0A2H0BVN3_9BACT|nr:MAG: mercuric reductase [Candidatus Roizmanbacteria bacterium CG22_combo_CG10-13_8_21_14_all_38_20]